MSHQFLPISALERIDLFTRLIDAFPEGHPLKRYRGDVYFEIVNFQPLFTLMRNEGWTSEQVNQAIDTHGSTLDPEELAHTTEWTDKLRAAVHEYDNYQALLVQWQRYDANLVDTGSARMASQTAQTSLPDGLPGLQAAAIAETDYEEPDPTTLLEHPLIEKIVVLLNYLAAEKEIPSSGEALLFELLHGPWFGIPPREITELALEVADRQYTEYITSLRRLLYEKTHTPPKNLFATGPHPGLQQACHAIEHLLTVANQVSLPDLLQTVLQDAGITIYINNSPDPTELVAAINSFTRLVTVGVQRNPSLDLSRFVHQLALLPYARWAVTLPPVDKNSDVLETLAIFYRPAVRDGITSPAPVDTVIPIQNGPTIARLELSVENKLVQRFVMHATALNSYLRCPLDFYFNILLRTPFPRNEATEFGSAVHWALELLFRKMQSNHEVFPPGESLLKDFEDYLHRHRASFTNEQFNRRLAYGRVVLSNYYEEYVRRWNTIVTVERNFRNVMVQGVPLKGKVDKLEFDGRSVNLVDYKTGDPDKSVERLSPPSPAVPYGGDYWRQAVFYKILVDNYQQKTWTVNSAEFDFIEPDKWGIYHKEKLFIAPQDVETVTQQFRAAWQRISDRNFYTGCGRAHCHWCHFVKSYDLSITPHE